jgi:hypothetical protein
MKNLIVFAGAGASRGISGEKYPMALDFRKRLPSIITNSPLYQTVVQHIASSEGADELDIEHILWELGRLSAAIGAWTDSDTLAANLLTSNRLEGLVGSNVPWPNVHAQIMRLRSLCNTLQDQINERVYDYYSKLPTDEEMRRSWIPFLDRLYSLEPTRLDIVTTNYDLVIEAALRSTSNTRVGLGVQEGMYPSIDIGDWRTLNTRTPGMLTKLHGSVDWKLGNESTDTEPVIRRGHPEFDGDHQKRLILYPGFKGIPAREPFKAFHKYFIRILKDATHILFIGFAFRDDHINDLIASNLRADCRVAVLNPASTLSPLSFLKHAIHIQQGFGMDKTATLLTSNGVVPFSLDELEKWID